MLRLLADENLHNGILRGLMRRSPQLDVVRVQDVGLTGAEDRAVLEWAAAQSRVVLTHDVNTMPHHAYERVAQGLRMPGLFAMNKSVPVGRLIEDLLLLAECSEEGEWEGQVRYLPLR